MKPHHRIGRERPLLTLLRDAEIALACVPADREPMPGWLAELQRSTIAPLVTRIRLALDEWGAYETCEPIHRAAVRLGRLGGAEGSKARAAKLSPEQRSEGARKAAMARWSNRSSTT